MQVVLNKSSKLANLKTDIKTNAPASIITRDNDKLSAPTGNIYESTVVISKRARQVSTKIKEELNSRLAEFSSAVDNLEEIFENKEQIEISRHYEKLPKPTNIATDEFLEGKVYFRRNEKE